MSEDEEIQTPPASIEIGTLSFDDNHATQEEPELTSVPEEKTKTSPPAAEPDDEPVNMQPLTQEANNAYTKYIKIKETKPSDQSGYAGIAVAIAGVVFGIMLIIDGDDDLGFFCCFGGCFAGIILILISLTTYEKWNKEKKLTLEDALVKAGIPDIPRPNQKPLGYSLLALGICALFMTDFFYNYYIIESVVFISGLVLIFASVAILLRIDIQDKNAMKKRMAIFELKRKGK